MATVRVDAKEVITRLSNMQDKAQLAIRMYAQEGAKVFENYAKTHRRWTDRTGHARQRLIGYVEQEPDKTRVCIAHGVNYGIYLEVCNNGRYSILQDTVFINGAKVLEGYKNMIGKMRV